MTHTIVRDAGDLADAVSVPGARIQIDGTLTGMPMLRLAPAVHLRGGTLQFGAKGVMLTTDNLIEDVTIATAEHEPAILNDLSQSSLGTLRLTRVRTVGQVLLLADGAVRDGFVEVEDLQVLRADVRGRVERPHAYGVDAMVGGFTLWNRQRDPASRVLARLVDIAAGSEEAPVRGSGVFVAGTDGGGGVSVSLLRTGAIVTDGGIAPGTPDLISGGVFVVYGAEVEEVINAGSVTTRGQNDMVLDNWGTVRDWTALDAVTSHGPSGIGFVNFGTINNLDVRAPLATHGLGARGFNLYDGRLDKAVFDGIETTGDGAVGIQVAREMPELHIRGDLRTTGGSGTSLVKGVQTELHAVALSVQKGGRIGQVTIGGSLETSGIGVTALEVDGEIGSLDVAGGIAARGAGARAIQSRNPVPGLDSIEVVNGD